MAIVRVLTTVLVVVGAFTPTTQAQTSRNPAALPRFFGGIGFESLKNDVPRWNGSHETPQKPYALEVFGLDSFAMRMEGGGAITAWLGAGVEFLSLPTRGPLVTSTIGTKTTTHRAESVVLAVGRGRLFRRQPIAVDLVGGIGAIFQDYGLRTEFCGLGGPGCVVFFDEHLNRASRALVVGIDAPVRIVSHLWAIPEIRFYHAPAPQLANGAEWRSPDRRAIGLTARAGW
jgi:hypothetical protein